MTPAERRKRPEHHVVHDYAISSFFRACLSRTGNLTDALLKIAPVNSHVWHAFYMNCRKMYEFFHHQKSKDYLRAQAVRQPWRDLHLSHWTPDVQKFMNTHMLHVGGGRVTNKKDSTGADDKSYLAEFPGMWEKMLKSLQGESTRRSSGRKIEHRLDSEFPALWDARKRVYSLASGQIAARRSARIDDGVVPKF